MKMAVLCLVAATLFGSGCAATRMSTGVEKHSLSILVSDGDSQQTSDGVTISVKTMAKDSEELADLVSLEEVIMATSTKTGKVKRMPPAKKWCNHNTVTTHQLESMVDWPTFMLDVRNETGHVISFARSVTALISSDGEVFNPSVPQRRSPKYKWIGANFDPIVPEGSYKTMLSFNVPREKLTPNSSWKLKIFDFVVETDAAGNPTKRTKFEFGFKPASYEYESEGSTCKQAFFCWDENSQCP